MGIRDTLATVTGIEDGIVKVIPPKDLFEMYNVPQFFEALIVDNAWSLYITENILSLGYRPEYILITGGDSPVEVGFHYKLIGIVGPTSIYFDSNNNRPVKEYTPYY